MIVADPIGFAFEMHTWMLLERTGCL